MIPIPLLLIIGPLAIAVILYLIRRATLIVSLLSAIVAIASAWLAFSAPHSPNETILGGWVNGGEQIILGRVLVLAPVDRPVLIGLSLTAAALFVLAGVLPRALGRPDDTFFPGLMALLGIAASILVTETFVFAVLLIEIAIVLVTALLQGARFGSTRGAWRFFLFSTLALPFLLVAGWQIDFQAANPGQTDLLNPAVLLLTLGFAIYLSAIPFHFWVVPAAGEAHPLVQPVAFGFLQVITISVIANAFEQYPWFADSEVPFQWFTFLGTLTSLVGAVLAFSSTSFGQLAGYNLLVDMGGLLLLLGTGSQAGLQVGWALILTRTVSLTIWGTGLAVIRARAGSDQIDDAANLGRSFPMATAALVMGGLALAGFPLTPGFPIRWMATGLIARVGIGQASLLLLGSASGVIGMARMVRTLLGSAPASPTETLAGRWRWVTMLALVVVLIGGLVISLFPNPIIAAAEQIASHFTFLQ